MTVSQEAGLAEPAERETFPTGMVGMAAEVGATTEAGKSVAVEQSGWPVEVASRVVAMVVETLGVVMPEVVGM